MPPWLSEHGWWVTLASVVFFLAGLAAGLILAIAMPADYFVRPHHRFKFEHYRRPALRITLRIVKNLAGALLLLLGIIMSVPLVPGPGVLLVLLGISLLDVPGKHAAERYIISRPMVLRSINALRARCHRPPIATRPAAGSPLDAPSQENPPQR